MDLGMRGRPRMERGMEKVSFSITLVGFMMVSGKMDRSMALELFTTSKAT